MPSPADLVPGAAEALAALEAAIAGAGVDSGLLALSRRRASQINGTGSPESGGRPSESAAGLGDEERAALALSEAVTRIADQDDPVPDRVWDRAATHFDQKELAALLLAIALTNAIDRLATATRRTSVN